MDDKKGIVPVNTSDNDELGGAKKYIPSIHQGIVVSGNTLSGIETQGGDVKLGVFQAPDPNKIALLIEAAKALSDDSPEYFDLIDELQNYHKPRPGRKIIGLENKLLNANMEKLLDQAKYLKGRASAKIARYELIGYKAAVHNYIYGKINEIFHAEIMPLIENGMPPDEINRKISGLIVKPIADDVASADPSINSDTVRGMLYILTGNCHLSWS